PGRHPALGSHVVCCAPHKPLSRLCHSHVPHWLRCGALHSRVLARTRRTARLHPAPRRRQQPDSLLHIGTGHKHGSNTLSLDDSCRHRPHIRFPATPSAATGSHPARGRLTETGTEGRVEPNRRAACREEYKQGCKKEEVSHARVLRSEYSARRTSKKPGGIPGFLLVHFKTHSSSGLRRESRIRNPSTTAPAPAQSTASRMGNQSPSSV